MMRATASCVVVLLLCYSIGKGLTNCDKCTGKSCEKDCSNSSKDENITCPPIDLPTNHCDTNNHQKMCVDNQPYIGINTDPLPDWIKCCDSGTCPYRNTGVLAAYSHLVHTWTAVNSKIAMLKLNWGPLDYSDSGFQLVIATVHDGHKSTVDRCMCIPAPVSTYVVNVSLSAGKSLDIKITGYPYPPTYRGKDYTTTNITAAIPSNCWHTSDASYSKCGPMLSSAPRNLTIVNITPSGSVVTITWEPPIHYNPNITAYKIEIENTVTYTFVIGARKYCGICNSNLSQATCQYNFTHFVAHDYVIKVSASSCGLNNSVDVDEQDCEDVSNINDIATNDTACWGESAVVTKILSSTPSAADNSQPQIVLIIVISSLSILLSLMVAIVIILIVTHTQLRRAAVNRYIPLVVDGDGYAAQRVFVINFPQSSEEDLCLVRKLCHKLAENSIKPVNYEYSAYDRQHGPGQSGIFQWAENNFTECNMILFVCNKSFYEAWNNGDTDQNSLISASKFLLQGHLSSNHSKDVSRFGIVLLRKAEEQYVPLCLRSLQQFDVFQDGQCVIESLLNQIS